MAFIKKAFVLAGKKKIKRTTIQFGKPNFENEWSEISEATPGEQTTLDTFKALGKTKWIILAKKGKMVRYTFAQAHPDKLENTEAGIKNKFKTLVKEKQKRAIKQIESGKIELSIVANYGDYKFLVAGNTRLVAQMELLGEAWVWEFKVSNQSTKSVKPSTEEQEKVTLKIFEELLKKTSPKWDKLGFAKLASQLLSKIYKDITHQDKLPREWYNHFELQFNEIRDLTKLPNNTFNVYDYDKFMDFITKLVVHEGPPGPEIAWPKFGKISKKDSWNPADIWLIKSGSAFTKIKEKLKESGTIKELNNYLKTAFHKNIIVGISLKKSSGKAGDLHYELNNLKKTSPKLPTIELTAFKIDLPFDNKKKQFQKTTNVLKVTNNGMEVGLMRTGTNTTGAGNNTYEFKGSGNVAAQMGKVPKDLMLRRFQVAGLNISTLPTMQEVEKKLPSKKGDHNYNFWKTVVTNIKKQKWIDPQPGFKLEDFPDILLSLNKRKIQKTESFAGQVVLFANLLYEVGKKKGKKEVHQVIEDFFYFAQKKGKVFGSEFGPFGKLY